jgi:hypothetical protein
MGKPFKWDVPAEKDIEQAVLVYLNFQVGCFAFKVDTRANFDPRLGCYRRLGKYVLAGTPDVLCSYSVNGIGIFIGFEIKNDTGRQSKHQVEFQERLQERSNGFYFLVRSVKDAEDALNQVKVSVQQKIGFSS